MNSENKNHRVDKQINDFEGFTVEGGRHRRGGAKALLGWRNYPVWGL